MDARLGGEAFHHRFRIGPTGNQTRVHEGAGLDVVQAGLGQRLDQLDLVGGADRAGLDLEAFAWAFFVDIDVLGQIGHGGFSWTMPRAAIHRPRRPFSQNERVRPMADMCKRVVVSRAAKAKRWQRSLERGWHGSWSIIQSKT